MVGLLQFAEAAEDVVASDVRDLQVVTAAGDQARVASASPAGLRPPALTTSRIPFATR